MKEKDVTSLTIERLDRLEKAVKCIAHRQYADSLLSKYKLKGYVAKKNDSKTTLEDPERSGWYVETYETGRVDVYEDGLLKRRVLTDGQECTYTYFPNGELQFEIWKDLSTGRFDSLKEYTESGSLWRDEQYDVDESGETVGEYVQTFEHTEKQVDGEHGRLIKLKEFSNDLVDKNETVYRVTVKSETGALMHARVCTIDDDVHVKYGEHEKLGNVLVSVKNCCFDIQPAYDEEGICTLTVVDKRTVGNPKKWIYLKETCRDSEVMTDWEKMIEFVKKKKYKKLMLKRHWYDFTDSKFTEKAVEILNRISLLETVDLNNVEFVKGSLCE